MKARVYLSVGALLLFLAPLGCSDKAESPAPETPPEEQPTPEPEKPEFVDANMSMEELMKTEDPDRNYRLVSYRDDTCAMYSFFDPMTELQRGTPRDQSQWVSETETAFAGLIVSPTETTTKPCVRHSNAGPKKKTRKNNRITIREKDVFL